MPQLVDLNDSLAYAKERLEGMRKWSPAAATKLAMHVRDSTFKGFAAESVPLTAEQRKALAQAVKVKEISTKDLDALLGLGPEDFASLPAEDNGLYGLFVERPRLKGHVLELYFVGPDRLTWDNLVVVVLDGNRVGHKAFWHKYDRIVRVVPDPEYVLDLEIDEMLNSGTGVWWDLESHYGMVDGMMVPTYALDVEVNQHIFPSGRTWMLQSKVVGQRPLRVAYSYSIELGGQYTDTIPFVKDSVVVEYGPGPGGGLVPMWEGSGLNAMRLASFSNMVATDSLFVHAWADLLEKELDAGNRAVVDYMCYW